MRSMHRYFAGYGLHFDSILLAEWLLFSPTRDTHAGQTYTHDRHSRRNLSLTWGSPTTLKMPADPSIA